jgi:hypothetical protein
MVRTRGCGEEKEGSGMSGSAVSADLSWRVHNILWGRKCVRSELGGNHLTRKILLVGQNGKGLSFYL